MSKKICIDPGHGGTDSGAVLNGRKESADVLKLGLLIRNKLISRGVTVVMTRETDKNLSVNSRYKLSNAENCDYFLSIHRNSGGGTGHEIWVKSNADAAETGKAKKILDSVCAVSKSLNRGVKKGAVNYSDFGVNKYTDCHSALLELGFIDNADDNASYDKYLETTANAIAKTLSEIVGADAAKETDAPRESIKGETEMSKGYFLNGDSNEGVYAYKQLLALLKKAGIISAGVDDNNIFGLGTAEATKQVQKAAGLAQDGLAGRDTIRACYTLLEKKIK